MTDPFSRFGIKHLSASSLNTWRSAPALWVVRYLHGVKDESGPEAMRGNAVEAGLVAMLRGAGLVEAIGVARSNYDANIQGELSDKIDAERAAIPDYLAQAAQAFAGKNAPLAGTQVKVELWLDGIAVPVMGYADMIFEDGSIVDLKTTQRIPSVPKPSHSRQVAIYKKARRSDRGFLLYASPGRSIMQPVEDTEQHISDLRRDALSLRRFLERSESPLAALESLPCDTDGFMWGDASRSKIKELLV